MKLNVNMKTQIATDCIKKQFEKAEAANAREEDRLGRAIYNSIVDAKTRKLLAQLPEQWMRKEKRPSFYWQGLRFEFKLNEPVVLTPFQQASCWIISDSALGEDAKAFAKLQNDFREHIHKTNAQLNALLGSVRTAEQLEKLWPEGKPFYKQYLGKEEVSGPPSILVADLNGMLGLGGAR